MSGDSKATSHGTGGDFDARRALDPARAMIPSVIRVNERRVTAGFWPKFRKVAAKIPFAGDLLAVWYCARDPATPATAKGLMLAALAYFVMPVDAIPDVLTVVGFTDDAAVFAAMMTLVGRHVKIQHRQAARDLLDRMAESG